MSKKVLYRRTAKVGKPSFTNVQLSHSGDNTSTVLFYQYDAAGNRVSKLTQTVSGIDSELLDDPSWPSADRITSTVCFRQMFLDRRAAVM